MTALPHNSIDQLFEALAAACAKQLGFNPTQVCAGMRYMGELSAGVHRFRDSSSHSPILLQLSPLKVTLQEEGGYWSEQELAFYRKSAAELDLQARRQDNSQAAAAKSAFLARYADYLLSLYEGHPRFSLENPTPSAGALSLVTSALAEGDQDAHALAHALHTKDPRAIASALLDAISEEQEQEAYRSLRANPLYPRALAALKALRALPRNASHQALKGAEQELKRLELELLMSTDADIQASMVSQALACDAAAEGRPLDASRRQ